MVIVAVVAIASVVLLKILDLNPIQWPRSVLEFVRISPKCFLV